MLQQENDTRMLQIVKISQLLIATVRRQRVLQQVIRSHPDEAQSLATAISDLQASPERAARLGAAARQSVQALTWKERARAILGEFS